MRGSRLAALAVALSAACGGGDGGLSRDDEGALTESGTLDVFALRIGDCYDDPAVDEAFDIVAKPCSEPHDNETFALVELAGVDFAVADDAAYPGDDSIHEAAFDLCVEEFEAFIGLPWQESEDIELTWLSPTEESWATGDRQIACAVFDSGGQTTGSLRNARR